MRYLSLFSGIGGFELGIGEKHECIGFSEIDKYATNIYQSHFPNHHNYGDITKINEQELPDFDLLCGGFPCQSFSIAGKRGGFSDTRGTLFFDIARIIKNKKPRLLLLENVKGLLSHDEGKTFATIISTLDELGYDLQWQVLNSKNHGVPQNRERIFIIGHLRGTPRPEVFPFAGEVRKDIESRPDDKQGAKSIATRHLGRNGSLVSELASTVQATETPHIIQMNEPKHSNDRVYDPEGISPTLNTMQGGMRQPFIVQKRGNNVETEHYIETEIVGALKASNQSNPRSGGTSLVAKTVRSGGRNSPHGSKQNWDSYEFEGTIRRLTPVECERLQGFPDGWTDGISDSQRYKCLGNAVTVNVIRDIVIRLTKDID